MVHVPGTNLIGQVMKHTAGATTVLTNQGKRTSWSHMTPVSLHIPQPIEKEEEDDSPTLVVKEFVLPKPKGKDAFGVSLGSKAADVNEYIFQKKRGIRVDKVHLNVEGTVKANVKSHLRRLAKDGFLKYNESRETYSMTGKTKE